MLRPPKRIVWILALGILVCIFLYRNFATHGSAKLHGQEKLVTSSDLPNERFRYCEDRYGENYLSGFRRTATEYCDEASQSSLTCFSNNVDPSRQRRDAFCIGSPARYEAATGLFQLDCNLKKLPSEILTQGIRQLDRFPFYWYSTGPRNILDRYISTRHHNGQVSGASSGRRMPTIILLKREIANFNLWHNLMELMSLMMSMDVLSSTNHLASHTLYWDQDAIKDTQVLLLDDLEDGPYSELYQVVSSKPTLHLRDLANMSTATRRIVLPLPGGSNPIWQGDWALLNCTSAPLLDDFVRRIRAHLHLRPGNTGHDQPLTLTFIDRATKRRLIDQERLLHTLRQRLPKAYVNAVDFASLSMKEQIQLVSNTDILVGVHGAGLTHAMFMDPQSAIVELMPFNLDHKGFHNLATMRGQLYFRTETLDLPNVTHAKGDWQEDDVVVVDDVFVDLVVEAVNAVKKLRGG